MKLNEYNWIDIQTDYDNGMTFRMLTAKYGIANGSLNKARDAGIFKSQKSRKSTMLKISTFNKKYDWGMIQSAHENGMARKDLIANFNISNCTLQNANNLNLISLRNMQEARRISDKCKNIVYVKFDEFVQRSIAIHGPVYTYNESKFTSTSVKIEIACSKHGVFLQLGSEHMRGYGCPKCARGKTSSKIENEFLDSIGISTSKRQARIDFPDGKWCIVDALDTKTNTIYELDEDFWHGNPDLYNPTDINPRVGKTYGELYERTIKRKLKLEELGYNVISIWGSDFLAYRNNINNINNINNTLK